MPEKNRLTAEEFGRRAGVSGETIRKYARAGKLKTANKPSKLLAKPRYLFDPDYVAEIILNGFPIEEDEAAGLHDQTQNSTVATEGTIAITQPAATSPKVSEDDPTIG